MINNYRRTHISVTIAKISGEGDTNCEIIEHPPSEETTL
jgi:hypothetical protein